LACQNSVTEVGVKGGEVIGHFLVPNSSSIFHLFLYKGAQMQDLGTLGGDASIALGSYGIV
jgi:probable HAF family extracellular repeat protein